MFDWTVTGAAAFFGGLGRIPEIGWLLGTVLVSGGVLITRESGLRVVRERLVLPSALLGGRRCVFLMLAGIR